MKLTRSQLLARYKPPPVDETLAVVPMAVGTKQESCPPDISDCYCLVTVQREGRRLVYRRVSDGMILGRVVEH